MGNLEDEGWAILIEGVSPYMRFPSYQHNFLVTMSSGKITYILFFFRKDFLNTMLVERWLNLFNALKNSVYKI